MTKTIKVCPKCNCTHRSDGARAVSYFAQGPKQFHADYDGSPIRDTRDEAMQDWCEYLQAKFYEVDHQPETTEANLAKWNIADALWDMSGDIPQLVSSIEHGIKYYKEALMMANGSNVDGAIISFHGPADIRKYQTIVGFEHIDGLKTIRALTWA